MAESVGEGSVNFTVKELLLVVDGKIDKLNDKLDHKADASEVIELRGRVALLEEFRSRAKGAGMVGGIALTLVATAIGHFLG